MNTKRALLFSPIAATFNPATYSEFKEYLVGNGYECLLIDTLKGVEHSNINFGALLNSMIAESSEFSPTLLFGHAFGGTIAREVAGNLTCSPRLITVSAPLLPTVHLKEKLTSIINSANESGIDSAVHLLETIVGNQSTGDVEISEESFDRIVSGMSMLVEYSPSPSALACLPKSLNICGYNSGLVKEADITSASASQSSVVPDAGMRVMNDNFNGFIKLVEEYLRS